jgi:deoxyribodipyrimidine photo-lyase
MNTCLKRLQLHCHCIQQFDDEPAMEMQALHKSYVGLRENEFRESLFEAWAEGKTGFPLIDAAMRALHRHGWINFRLRALLVNFASYQLWLHWREPALHLARLMTDYEPGIHYPAVQSQAGTAGMRQWRILDPVAQSQELDPEGLFIKVYCPELAEINGRYLHSPWLMSHGEQVISSCVLGEDYPLPVVNHEKAAENAWQNIRSWLLTTYDPAETERLIVKHGTADMVEAFQDKTLIRGQVNPESHLLPYEEDDS